MSSFTSVSVCLALRTTAPSPSFLPTESLSSCPTASTLTWVICGWTSRVVRVQTRGRLRKGLTHLQTDMQWTYIHSAVTVKGIQTDNLIGMKTVYTWTCGSAYCFKSNEVVHRIHYWNLISSFKLKPLVEIIKLHLPFKAVVHKPWGRPYRWAVEPLQVERGWPSSEWMNRFLILCKLKTVTADAALWRLLHWNSAW